MNKFTVKLSLTYIVNTMVIITTTIYRIWGTCALTPRPRHLRNNMGGKRKKREGKGGGESKREMRKGVRFPLLSFSLSPYLSRRLPCG